MPSFGPVVVTPAASTTDGDPTREVGQVPGLLDDLLTAPQGYMRVITKFWAGVFTAITAIRVVRGREELGNFRGTMGTAFDIQTAVNVQWGYTGKLKLLLTTGAAAVLTLYFEYIDLPL